MISVFTPSHDTRWLTETYESLAKQTHKHWEWVVLLNGKARTWTPPAEDPRVRVYRSTPGVRGVGALKREAVSLTCGEILVELDHDDMLLDSCLERLQEAFDERPDLVFAYSDFAQINADRTPNLDHFNTDNGWVYTPEQVGPDVFERCHAMPPTPHNLGYIWYEPNHVRAFRRDAYDAVGGYDPSLGVLDDQELMMRLFQYGDFQHVDELLYLQRVHGANTQSDPMTNAHIQARTVELYQENIGGLVHAWGARQGLASVRLLPTVWFGPESEPGFDDARWAGGQLPYDDDSVSVIMAYDLLQKVADRATLFNECYRVLAPNGLLLTLTPSTDGRGAFQDPSHVAFYNENSFLYLTQEVLRPALPELTARLQVSHLRTHFPSASHEAMQISYVTANLIAVKDGQRNGGPLLC